MPTELVVWQQKHYNQDNTKYSQRNWSDLVYRTPLRSSEQSFELANLAHAPQDITATPSIMITHLTEDFYKLYWAINDSLTK